MEMEGKLIAITMETMKIALVISMPMLLAGLLAGLAISIFQATTQINEATLTFLPFQNAFRKRTYQGRRSKTRKIPFNVRK